MTKTETSHRFAVLICPRTGGKHTVDCPKDCRTEAEVCSACGKERRDDIHKEMPDLDLSKTAAALEAFDKFEANFDTRLMVACDNVEVDALLAEYRNEERRVAEAYADDTADRNSRDRVLELIRPGPREPGAGAEPSLVRKMVQRWKDSQK